MTLPSPLPPNLTPSPTPSLSPTNYAPLIAPRSTLSHFPLPREFLQCLLTGLLVAREPPPRPQCPSTATKRFGTDCLAPPLASSLGSLLHCSESWLPYLRKWLGSNKGTHRKPKAPALTPARGTPSHGNTKLFGATDLILLSLPVNLARASFPPPLGWEQTPAQLSWFGLFWSHSLSFSPHLSLPRPQGPSFSPWSSSGHNVSTYAPPSLTYNVLILYGLRSPCSSLINNMNTSLCRNLHAGL